MSVFPTRLQFLFYISLPPAISTVPNTYCRYSIIICKMGRRNKYESVFFRYMVIWLHDTEMQFQRKREIIQQEDSNTKHMTVSVLDLNVIPSFRGGSVSLRSVVSFPTCFLDSTPSPTFEEPSLSVVETKISPLSNKIKEEDIIKSKMTLKRSMSLVVFLFDHFICTWKSWSR